MRATERRARTTTPEDRVPGHSCSGLSNPLGLQAEGTGETRHRPFLFFFFFSPARGRAEAASGRRAAPRLLLLLGWLNRDFVKRDR